MTVLLNLVQRAAAGKIRSFRYTAPPLRLSMVLLSLPTVGTGVQHQMSDRAQAGRSVSLTWSGHRFDSGNAHLTLCEVVSLGHFSAS